MSKTLLGESNVNPKRIDSAKECETVAQVIDFSRWKHTEKGLYKNIFKVFFQAFRDKCANYDRKVNSERTAKWLHREISSFLTTVKTKETSQRRSVVTAAWDLAEETDRRVNSE
jgi:hypothetical protein